MQGVVPEISVIVRAQNLNRRNWTNLIKEKKLVPPYCIVESGESIEEDWARDNISWRQPVKVHYIASTEDSNALTGEGYDIARYCESKVLNIATSALTYVGSGMQLAGKLPTTNISDWTMVNQVIYKINAPVFAGTVTMELLWGAYNGAGTLWT